MGLAGVLIFLVLAAQFNSFRDPFIIILGSVPLAIFGASIFMFLRMPNPNLTLWTDSCTTTFNIYSQVGLVTLVGPDLQERHSDRGVRQQAPGAGQVQARGGARGGDDPAAAGADDQRGHDRRATCRSPGSPAPGAAARNSIGLVLVGGMTIGTFFTLFVVPCVYILIARDHAKDRAREAAIDQLNAPNFKPAQA